MHQHQNVRRHQNHIHFRKHFFPRILWHRLRWLLVIRHWLQPRILLGHRCRLHVLSWRIRHIMLLLLVCVGHFWGFLCLCKYQVQTHRHWWLNKRVYLNRWVYLPSGLTLGMKEYFNPEGKPAPPLPLSPLFLISSMIQSGPKARMSLVLCQSP